MLEVSPNLPAMSRVMDRMFLLISLVTSIWNRCVVVSGLDFFVTSTGFKKNKNRLFAKRKSLPLDTFLLLLPRWTDEALLLEGNFAFTFIFPWGMSWSLQIMTQNNNNDRTPRQILRWANGIQEQIHKGYFYLNSHKCLLLCAQEKHWASFCVYSQNYLHTQLSRLL